MVIKSWCRYFTGKFIRAWPAITLHAPDMNEKLWDKKRKLEDAYDRVMSELEDYSGPTYGGVTERCLRCLNIFTGRCGCCVAGEWLFSGHWFFASITGAEGQAVVSQDFFDIYLWEFRDFFCLFTWGIGILLN